MLRDGLAGCLLSQDGTRIVAKNMLDGSYSIWPIQGGEPERIAGMQPDEDVMAWAEGGKSFWVRSQQPASIKIYHVDAATGRRRFHRQIEPPPTGLIGFSPERGNVRITPDGKVVVYSYWRALHELWVAEGLR